MGQARCLCLRVSLLVGLLAAPAVADHPRDFRAALDGLRAGRMGAVDKVYLKDASRDGADRLLALFELGGLYQMAGDFRRSMDFFNTADAVARDYEGRAVVSAGTAGRAAGAVLVNDKVMKYEGPAYEKVLSRTLNALNYLLVGDLEGTRVELRKAEEYQRQARERHQREIQGQEGGIPGPAMSAGYGRMFDSVKDLRNSYENAFTYYLASQVCLAQGEDGLNDAMVEIRNAFQLAPLAPPVRSAYREIARAQGGPAWDEARQRLGPDAGEAAADAGTGAVVVVFETGLVPRMEPVKINLVADDKLYSLAFPIYQDLGAPRAALSIAGPARTLVTTDILDTRRLAVKSLEERMPGILARGLAGAAAKGEVQDRAEKNFGFLGGLLSKVATAVVTSADLRSWLSLPAEVQVAGFNIPPGRVRLELRAPGLDQAVPLDVAPGSRSFVVVRALPGFSRVDAKTFPVGGRGAPPNPPAASPAKVQ